MCACGIKDMDKKYLYYEVISLPLLLLSNLILTELSQKSIVKGVEVTIWTWKGTFFVELFALFDFRLFNLLLLSPAIEPHNFGFCWWS